MHFTVARSRRAFSIISPVARRNAGDTSLQGLGLTVGRHFGSAVNGSVTYRFGRGARPAGPTYGASVAALGFEEAQFHDLVARLETFIGWTGALTSPSQTISLMMNTNRYLFANYE